MTKRPAPRSARWTAASPIRTTRARGRPARARAAAPPRKAVPAARRAAGAPVTLPPPGRLNAEDRMGTATGAQLLVRMLKAEGVRHLFTLSGLHIAPIYAACVEEGIQLVDTRHEQAAAHAADAYRGSRAASASARDGRAGRHRCAHRHRQRVRREQPGAAPRRRRAQLQRRHGQPARDGAGGPLPPHQQVVRSHSRAGPGAHLSRQGLPHHAHRAARARSSSRCPGTCSPTAWRRASASCPDFLPDQGAAAGRSGLRGARRADALAGGAAAVIARQLGLLGRRPRSLPRFGESAGGARVPQRSGPRLPAGGSPHFFCSRARTRSSTPTWC